MPSEEGELRWVDIDRVIASAAKQSPALHAPADLPLILPRILDRDEIMTVRLEYETEDSPRPLSAEIIGG